MDELNKMGQKEKIKILDKCKYIEDNIKPGMVVKMNVASRSHEKKPYYVEILYVDNDIIRTSIPKGHSLDIVRGHNWYYHVPRMEIIGDKKDFGRLLYNQKLRFIDAKRIHQINFIIAVVAIEILIAVQFLNG